MPQCISSQHKNKQFLKLENLEEMDKFLDAYNQPKLNQEDINHLKRPITSKEAEAVIKGLLTKRAQNLMDSQLNSNKPLKKT
jgi:hypothetical protein